MHLWLILTEDSVKLTSCEVTEVMASLNPAEGFASLTKPIAFHKVSHCFCRALLRMSVRDKISIRTSNQKQKGEPVQLHIPHHASAVAF